MFKTKIAISKDLLIAIFILTLIFCTLNLNLDKVNAADLNESVDEYGLNAIELDKLGNSQNEVLQSEIELNGGTFSDIQNAIHGASDGDTIILVNEFEADNEVSPILVYKKLNFISPSGAVLNAKGITNVFNVLEGAEGSNFTNLIFKNAVGTISAAAFIETKDISFNNCRFENGYATSNGGAISTVYNVETRPDAGRNLLVNNCVFYNNSAGIAAGAMSAYGDNVRILNCIFDSNYVRNNEGVRVYGGAIQIGRDEIESTALVKDCVFINNRAISSNGSPNSHGGAACVRDGITYENCQFIGNSADEGGALTYHASGLIKNCIFKDNEAYEFGGALSTGWVNLTMNLIIEDCNFENNKAPYGGAVQLNGMNINIDNCNFTGNNASIDGGAIRIGAKIVNIVDSNFNNNVACHNGGAVYVNGESTTIQESSFRLNKAIPDPFKLDDGLGGAIYINGSYDNIRNNIFEYNVARNGSAIYYDKTGKKLIVTNNKMSENQAWVYALPIYTNDIYFGEIENFGATIYGGNNIANVKNLAVSNAIFNAASYKNIEINGYMPVNGATNSGEIYQDGREYNIDILLTVQHEDGTIYYNQTLKSNYLGEVSDSLANLKAGKYYVTATHFEDNYYKAIVNTTSFKVIANIDVGIDKSSNDIFNYHDEIVWTLTVFNNGPSNATGVNVSDVLPNGLIYKSYVASKGSYSNGIWRIGNLDKGKSETINITTIINKTGEIVNRASVYSNEFDWNLSNNNDSKRIIVNSACDLSITKMANVSTLNYGNLVKWTLVVMNNGPDDATGVNVSDILPSGLVYKSGVASKGSYSDGLWVIGNLARNEQVTLDIITQVTKTGLINNTAQVYGYEYDYNLANNVASSRVNVLPASDLAISKKVNNSTPNYHDLIKWTLVVTNNGPDDASGVNVSDVLPSGLVYKSGVASKGSYSDGFWVIGNLARNDRVTLDIITQVNGTGIIGNIADVRSKEHDINESNNIANESIVVSQASDLAVIKLVNDSAPYYHELVKWTLVVTNNGPDIAHDIIVSDVLPDGLVLKSTKGNYSNNKWIIDKLNVNSSISLDIITFVNRTGLIYNNVSVKGREFDYILENNENYNFINVSKSCDIEISKVVSNYNPNYPDSVKWIVLVKNNGPDIATGVEVIEEIPDGLILSSSRQSKGYYNNGIWHIGQLEAFEQVNLEIFTKINKTGNITNYVIVYCDEYDYNLSNNYANKSIDVNPAADIAVTKKVNNTSPNYNDLVKWTISVTNNGPDNANNVEVKDNLPVGIEIIKFDASRGCYQNGVWKVNHMEVGETVDLNIITRVKSTGNFINVAIASADEYDYDYSNNRDDDAIDVANACDLQITKIVNQSTLNYHDLVKWTLIVKNNGPDDATRVVVRDLIPEGLNVVSSQGDGTFSSIGVWYAGNIPNGQTKQIDIVTYINKTGEFENIVNVSSDQYDFDLTNNKDFKFIHVNPACDLAIIKTVSKPEYYIGDLVSYKIEVINNGPDSAENIEISEFMDDSLIFDSVIFASGDYDYVNHIWKIKSLSNGEKAVLNLYAIALKEGLSRNMVSVKCDTYDYDLSNNDADAFVNIFKMSVINNNKLNHNIFKDLKYENDDLNSSNGNESFNLKFMETGIPIILLEVIFLFLIICPAFNISKKR